MASKSGTAFFLSEISIHWPLYHYAAVQQHQFPDPAGFCWERTSRSLQQAPTIRMPRLAPMGEKYKKKTSKDINFLARYLLLIRHFPITLIIKIVYFFCTIRS